MSFKEFLKHNIVMLDGGFGTMLQSRGLQPGEHPERWNLTHADVIIEIHKSYFDAGSNVVCTNTFGANALKFEESELEQIITAAVSNANAARENSISDKPKFIALDIGPLGKLLSPLGDLEFEKAVEAFAKTVKIGARCGVDLVVVETMNDSYETKAALLAVKENCSLPVIVSNVYGEDGKLMTGATPETMVAMLEGMDADAIGANCSLGPKQLSDVAKRLIACASVPVVLKPNAGLPKAVDGKTVFDIDANEFALEVCKIVKQGVRVVGGCCGTTPEYISKLNELVCNQKPLPIEKKSFTVVSSYSHAVKFGNVPLLIGERINPTGKKRFKQALLENDINYILDEGVNQQEKGVHILDVNVGLPDIDEPKMLETTVKELQAVSNLPLQIDTSNVVAMEKALRIYNGKAMVNSVNGKRESMEQIFPLVKKYGGVVVALTLDENGIPADANGRVEIAKKILDCATDYGIDKKDIVFDALAMTVSADNKSAGVTLEALYRIKTELGCHTSLGVSNVSFGLPCRDAINSTFFAMCLQNGMSAAIMNPYSADMMRVYHAYKALAGLDDNCAEYIDAAQSFTVSTVADIAKKTSDLQGESPLSQAIIKGFKDNAKSITKQLLKSAEPLDIVNNEIIPALNTVGEGFEKKTVYLPQLLMSAEAAKSAFEQIKSAMAQSKNEQDKGMVVIATVKGDIHDIGKNIVKLLLENYGYKVVDLGKDVEPQAVVDAVVKTGAKMVGLSALMTTTVPAMEETIKLIKVKAPKCKVIVGGAVLNKEYAQKIGADMYAKDAMGAVRYAQTVID